jgi:acyl-CoA thioesterase II
MEVALKRVAPHNRLRHKVETIGFRGGIEKMTVEDSYYEMLQEASDKGIIDDLLMLAPLDGEADCFAGKGGDYPVLGVYGGHLVGQALKAAFLTVEEDVLATSFHLNFLNAPKVDAEITYKVERLRDGRRFKTRSIRAYQNDTVIVSATATFKKSEDGDEHQVLAPEISTAAEFREARLLEKRPPLLLPITGHGVEIETLGPWSPITADLKDPHLVQWMRGRVAKSTDLRHQQCVLAYLSDSTALFAALRPHGSVQTHATTSLDHSIWFHGTAEPDNWMIFDLESPIASDNRGLTKGTIFGENGQVVAVIAQESSMSRR